MASSYFTFVKQAGTGVQTIAGVGRRGKAAILFSVRMTADGVVDGAHLCQGVCDANGQACRAIGHPGNETVTTSSQCEFKNRIIVFTNQTASVGGFPGTTPTIEVEGRFVQFTANGGLEIDWIVNDGQPLIIHVVMFDVPEATLSLIEALSGVDTVVTGLGYQPKVLLATAGALDENSSGTPDDNYVLGSPFGCFHSIGFSDGTQQLCAISKARATGAAVECTYAAMPFDRVTQMITANLTINTPRKALATSLDADGFTCFVQADVGTTPETYFLTMGGASLQAAIGDVQIPTSSGSVTISLGWQPDVVFFIGVGSIAGSMSIFLGALARNGSQGGVWIGGTDGTSPSVLSRANFSDACVRSYTPALSGASTIKNNGVGSIGASDFTVAYDTVMSTSGSPIRNVYFLAVSVPPVNPVPIPTPLAAQTPCAPKTQLGNGGKGKAGTSALNGHVVHQAVRASAAPPAWPDAWQAFDVVGLACPYGVLSTPADPQHPVVTIARGSFTEAIAAGGASLRLDFEDFETLDVSQANGRLMFWEDAAGLMFGIRLPATQTAALVQGAIEDGKIRHCCIEFEDATFRRCNHSHEHVERVGRFALSLLVNKSACFKTTWIEARPITERFLCVSSLWRSLRSADAGLHLSQRRAE